MKLVKMKCENCGATLEVNENLDKINCNFCGAEILIDDEAAELRRIEEVKLQARQKNHEQTIKERKELEELNTVNNFKKGKLSKLLLIFAAICGIITFTKGFSLAGIISFIQTALFITSWLLGMKIIKHQNNNLYIILAFIAFALIIPFFLLGNKNEKYDYSRKCEEINWNDIYLKDQLVNMDNATGEMHNNSKEDLYANFCQIDRTAYEKYRDEIIEKGYTIDAEDKTNTYLAYNEEGYKIYLNWQENDSELSIDLDVPIEMSEFIWPTVGLATKLPKPNSTFGKISWDNDDTFGAYIGNTTIQDFENYTKICQDAGFVNNRSSSEKRYSATNDENYEVVLEYHGYNTMYISVDAPDDTDIKDETNNIKQEEKNTITNNSVNNNNGIRTDFKNAMDSYEQFIDEYISFMQKYNTNPSDYTLLNDYSNYILQYSEMAEKFAKWTDENLNVAETEYYIEVQTRVNNKLTDAALDL